MTSAAGDFASWVTRMQGAIRGENGFGRAVRRVHRLLHLVAIRPHRARRDRHALPYPAELRFPAPRLPHGHVLLGYDKRGHCPMLVDNQCSIYAHRPRTCRTYDCRVFPAAGLGIDDDDKTMIDRQARRWRFSFPTPAERTQLDAVRAAATFLQEHTDLLPSGTAPTNATQLAVLAIELHDLFLRRDRGDTPNDGRHPDLELVKVELIAPNGSPWIAGAPVLCVDVSLEQS